MRKHTIYTLLLIMLFIFSGCNSHSKEQKISEAFTKRSQKNLNQLEKVKKDITPPTITSLSPEQTYTVNQIIDLDKIKASLSAEDNVDGDITDDIKFVSSSITPHQEGNYKIIYSVKDSASNISTISIKINITSKYTSNEKNRLSNAITACEKIKQTYNLTNIYFNNIIANEDGNNIIIDYSGDTQNNEYIDSRLVYYHTENKYLDLSQSSNYPSGFEGTIYEYDEYDLKDFKEYYHME